MKDVIIVGGGASGIVCAIMLAQKGKDVLIIEKQDRIGKKILATGNGRCNLTNISGFEDAYNQDITQFMSRFSYQDTLNFFNTLGLITYPDQEGRVYPVSNTATSVLDVLRYKIDNLNVDVKTSEEVVKIKKENGKVLVKTDKGTYESKNVVVSVGGKIAEPLFDDFKVKINKSRPVLCSLKTNKFGSLSGVRQSGVAVKFKDFYEQGEVLFKDSAISGIVIFNLSFYMVKNNINQAEVEIDLLPDYSFGDLVSILNLRNKQKLFTPENFLTGIFHKELGKAVLLAAGLKNVDASGQFTDVQIKQIVSKIKKFNIKVTGFCDNNQVFAGGIDLSEVDKNLGLKKYPNIFVTGEALDVYAKCGGYNLQWAFCSAAIVANSI